MAVTGSMFLITDVLFGLAAALPTALGVAAMFGWFWYAAPPPLTQPTRRA